MKIGGLKLGFGVRTYAPISRGHQFHARATHLQRVLQVNSLRLYLGFLCWISLAKSQLCVID